MIQKDLSVFVCQLTSVDDVSKNLKSMLNALESVPGSQDIQFVTFPENCLYLRVREGQKIPALNLGDPVFEPLVAIAKQKKLVIHLGSVPLLMNGKVFNSTVVIKPSGELLTPYQKIHLFDVDVDGLPPIRESDAFAAGSEPQILEVEGWKMGLTICYDLRFAELYLRYRQLDADVILVPSAFTVPTGKAHWEVLLRARAIESQAYVLAAAQGGLHRSENSVRKTYGHSLVVNPWGEIVASGDQEPVLLHAVLERALVNKVRAQIPMKSHVRLGKS